MNKTTNNMLKDTDIAWLAGILDGEGSFVLFKDKRANRGINVHVTMNMVDKPTIDLVARHCRVISGDRCNVREKHPLSGFSRRPQFVVDVSSKRGCLRVLQAVRPYLVTKALQADLIMNILGRAVNVRKYQCNALDYLMMTTVKRLKHEGSGESRAEAILLLSQVTPSQAVQGSLTGSRTEGVETRGMSPNNNSLHERPAPIANAKDEDIVQAPDESRGSSLNSSNVIH